jgi:hypothetical protein
LFKGYGAKICRLTTYVKAENRMVTIHPLDYCIYQQVILLKACKINKR